MMLRGDQIEVSKILNGYENIYTNTLSTECVNASSVNMLKKTKLTYISGGRVTHT